MKRWGRAIFCWIGVLVGLTAVSAAASSANRSATSDRHAATADTAKPVRHHRMQTKVRNVKVTRHADKSRRPLKAASKSSHRRVKAEPSQIRVFDAGRAYSVGKPYVIGGRTYTPRVDPDYRAEGKASWYGGSFHGRLTANGEKFDMNAISAAHPTLPLPSYVRVTNLQNQRSLVVRVNDRGPYHDNRLIDVSVRAAELLGFHDQGVAQVRVEFIGLAELAGSGQTKLALKP